MRRSPGQLLAAAKYPQWSCCVEYLVERTTHEQRSRESPQDSRHLDHYGGSIADYYTMKPKVVLITGASSGIGLALAELLAQSKEYIVVATARKPDVIREKAKAGNYYVKELDVTNDSSVHMCVAETIKEYGRIDVLVNNAGFGARKNTEQMSLKDHQGLFDCNYFGVVRMLKECLPHMREAKKGQLIIVTSLGGFEGFPFADAYSASKFALEGLAESLAPQLRNFNISTSLIEPGPVSTPFAENIPKNHSEAAAEAKPDAYTPYKDAFWKNIMAKMFAAKGVKQTAEEVAEVVKQAIEDAEPHMRYQTSDFVHQQAKKKLVDPSGDSLLKEQMEEFQ